MLSPDKDPKIQWENLFLVKTYFSFYKICIKARYPINIVYLDMSILYLFELAYILLCLQSQVQSSWYHIHFIVFFL